MARNVTMTVSSGSAHTSTVSKAARILAALADESVSSVVVAVGIESANKACNAMASRDAPVNSRMVGSE
jgi:hypothetical protein